MTERCLTLWRINFLATDYHSGMDSRGYRLLCRTQRALKRLMGETMFRRLVNSRNFYVAMQSDPVYIAMVRLHAPNL